MLVMPWASQVDKTRHGDTQKAALMEKDSRMVGAGAGAERRQEKESQGGRAGAERVNPAAAHRWRLELARKGSEHSHR